uniref:Predicted protein n=1 Tax=Hordeum vulgare subsp. vulgare TaxID=112509 RepID=F2DJI9_HORVV|nr:predicted protein [Hordeum vulgare subsp. vulgare]
MGSGSVLRLVKSCFVTPSGETPRKRLWLSALDLVLASRGHTPLVHFYSAGDVAAAGDGFFSVARLKESLAKALVPFYPLAGRLGVDPDGRFEIDCNGEGALFVVAHSDRTFDDFSDHKPTPETRRLFCPPVQPSSVILAVQVTFLRCGGVVLGTATHHAAADGPSTFHFIRTWAGYCRDGEGAAVELPCHERGLLRARSPPVIHPDTIPTFCSRLPQHDPSGAVATQVFTFSEDQLRALKRQRVLRRERPRVAVRLRRPAAAPGGDHAHQLPGGHQAPPHAAAAGPLLRQRGRQRVRRRCGEGRRFGDAGLRGQPGEIRDGAARR